MLSFQLKNQISDILNAFEEADYFIAFLERLDDTYIGIRQSIDKIAEGTPQSANVHNQTRANLQSLKGQLEGVKPRKLFKTIENLKQSIKSITESGLNDNSLLIEIDERLEDMLHTYETYIDDRYLAEHAANLVFNANSLLRIIDTLEKSLKLYLNNIDDSALESNDNQSNISILLPSTMNLSEFHHKLQAFEQMYNELCMILNISVKDYPIQIIKIESGSFFGNFLGHKTVIDFIVNALKAGAHFAHRNFTKEGKIEYIPKKVESIESVIGLKAMLSENGINTDEIDHHIKKASVSVANDLNTLLSGQNKITVNEDTLLITEDDDSQLITHEPLKIDVIETPLQIENKNKNENENE